MLVRISTMFSTVHTVYEWIAIVVHTLTSHFNLQGTCRAASLVQKIFQEGGFAWSLLAPTKPSHGRCNLIGSRKTKKKLADHLIYWTIWDETHYSATHLTLRWVRIHRVTHARAGKDASGGKTGTFSTLFRGVDTPASLPSTNLHLPPACPMSTCVTHAPEQGSYLKSSTNPSS